MNLETLYLAMLAVIVGWPTAMLALALYRRIRLRLGA